MLTMGAIPGIFTVGENPIPAVSSADAKGILEVSSAHPAPRTGVLASVTVGTNGGGTIYAVTGSLNTSTGAFVVTATAAITATNGLKTYVVSLPINAGDVVGCWSPFSGGVGVQYNYVGSTWWRGSVGNLPSGTYTLTTNAGTLLIQATGT